MKKIEVKAIFLSDIHLGSKGCQADLLLTFLKQYKPKKLFLVGDIIDCWRLKSKLYWPQSHSDVLRKFLTFSKNGTKVHFVTGNHDDFLRRYQPLSLGNIELNERFTYTSKGKKYLVIHGDQFDVITRYGRYISVFGDRLYSLLLVINRYFNQIRYKLGYDYWSLSNYLKQRVKKAVNFISDFEDNVAAECKKKGFDGVICGHIHKVAISEVNQVQYMNCGDWVESCTGIIEHLNGEFEIIDFSNVVNSHYLETIISKAS